MKITLYHGSSNKNLRFKPDSVMWFTTNKESAKEWADRIILGGKRNKASYIYTVEYDVKNAYEMGDAEFNSEYAKYADSPDKDDIYIELFMEDINEYRDELVFNGFDCARYSPIANETHYAIFYESRKGIKWIDKELVSDELDEQVMYHGTTADFNKFDRSYYRRGDYGYGFYFTRSKNDATYYAAKDGYLLTCEIPDEDQLMDWDFHGTNSPYVKECMNKLIEDLYEKDTEVYDYIYTGYYENRFPCGWVWYRLAEKFEMTGEQLADLFHSYGIKGIWSLDGGCSVVFKADDIKIIDKQPIRKKELVTESDNKIIAYHGGKLDKIHDGHLYFTNDLETAKYYGNDKNADYKIYKCELTFQNPIVFDNGDEYDDYIQEISSWDDVIEQGYDSIICEEEPKYYVALKPVEQVKILDTVTPLNERLEDIGAGYVTNNPKEIVQLFKNKPQDYRVLYDKNIGMYMICDGESYLHQDMLEDAYRAGLYYAQEDYIRRIGAFQNYIEIGQDGGFDVDDTEIEPYLWYIVFSPSEEWEVGIDGYDTRYKYDFGYVLTRGCDLSDIPLWDALGVPQETLRESVSIYQELNRILEEYIN